MPALSIRRIPDPAEPVPFMAVPALGLLVAGLTLWIGATVLYVEGELSWALTIPLNAIASYLLFTVAHDASHHSISRVDWLNDLLGRLATPLFALHAAFPVWRFVHMQHHRFTNHEDGSDPDRYTMRGGAWQRPLRWLTIDYHYVAFYLPKLASRPRRERVEGLAFFGLGVGVPIVLIATGNVLTWLVVLWVPSRLAVLFLAWAFDYLPHNGLDLAPTEDRFKTTRNRVGMEGLISPVLLYQNYHLVHHLHPVIPFHRYLAVWRRNEQDYLANDPALSTVRGRAITAEEYRQMRELATHHH